MLSLEKVLNFKNINTFSVRAFEDIKSEPIQPKPDEDENAQRAFFSYLIRNHIELILSESVSNNNSYKSFRSHLPNGIISL